MKKKMFHTGNGSEVFELKTYDGSLVPLGYYYEDAYPERLKTFLHQLKESVFPVIERLVADEIPKFFYLSEKPVLLKVFGSHLKNTFELTSIKDIFQQIITVFEIKPTHDTDLFFNITFQAYNRGKLKNYGCQIKVIIGPETIQDIETGNEYAVWYLYIGEGKTALDIPFSRNQEDKIIGCYLGMLWQSEENKEVTN
jgi:hypothetical protein